MISSDTPEKTKRNKADEAITETLNELIIIWGLGIVELGRLLWRRPFIISVLIGSLCFGSYYAISRHWQIQFIHSWAPTFLTYKKLAFLKHDYFYLQHSILLFLVTLPLLILLGIRLRFIRTKYQKLFVDIGLTNGSLGTPILVRKTPIYLQSSFRNFFKGPDKTLLEFDARSLGLSEFETKKERLEASFDRTVESIVQGKSNGRILLTLSRHKLPKKILVSELEKLCSLSDASFYVGMTNEGPLVQCISELPHLIIAGSTGTGKSVFYKQEIYGLLKSTKYLHVYLIDLKRGLEAVDFKEAPNVSIVKNISDAVLLLRKLEKEMQARFDFLEKMGFKEIVPHRDLKERIVIAVDESSVLHQRMEKGHTDYKLTLEARSLIDSISKLSRAAAMHLVLATQKIDKVTIPTSVQENIVGRMAFKANTLQGSLVVLGNKEAMDLPHIPGRGIWKVGAKEIQVQAPLITDQEIRSLCQNLKADFESGKRKLFQPLFKINASNSSAFDFTKRNLPPCET